MSKTIYFKHLVDNREYELVVGETETIREIKRKIEQKLGITIKNKLMIKHKGKRNFTSLEDENKTVSLAHIKNGDIIQIAKTDVVGGLYFFHKYME